MLRCLVAWNAIVNFVPGDNDIRISQRADGMVVIESSLNGAAQSTQVVDPAASDRIVVNAGSGDDQIFVDDSVSANLLLAGGDGQDFIYGGGGNEIVIDGDDLVRAGGGTDIVLGGRGNDNLEGQDGSDLLFGQEGDDYLSGDKGSDIALGGEGQDTLYGGVGEDLLMGEQGDDYLDALDIFHRAGDTLFRAKPNRVGVAGVQFSEEIDFSIEYFLQRGE